MTFYDIMHGGLLSGQNRLPEWIREFTQPREILEIGCRTGANLTLLAKAFPEAKLTGVDTSSTLLSKARNPYLEHPNVEGCA